MSLQIDRKHIENVAFNAAGIIAFFVCFAPTVLIIWKYPNTIVWASCLFVGGFFALTSLLVEIKKNAWINFLQKYYISHFDIEVHEI